MSRFLGVICNPYLWATVLTALISAPIVIFTARLLFALAMSAATTPCAELFGDEICRGS